MSIAYYNVKNEKFNMLNDKISKKVKLERIKANLTQEQLAFEAGISRNAIQKIETGKVKPTIETLEKIAKALNMNFNTFIDVSKVDL